MITDTGYEKREAKRREYRPERIRWLLVAEAPPDSVERFFYFEDVQDKDALFYETMDVLYGGKRQDIFAEGDRDIKRLRREKRQFLLSFMNDGFYLVDATDNPITKDQKKSRNRIVWESRENLVKKINTLKCDETKVILITPSVYRLKVFLLSRGVPVINDDEVSFPLQKGRENFRRSMQRLLSTFLASK